MSKDYIASLRERAKKAFDSAIVPQKAEPETPLSISESTTSPNSISIPSPIISNISSPTKTSQVSDEDGNSSGESFQYVRGTVRESSEASSNGENLKEKGKLFISTHSSVETVEGNSNSSNYLNKDIGTPAPSTSAISDRTIRPLPTSYSSKALSSMNSVGPLPTSHPFYSIHDPRNSIETPKPQESSTRSTSISPSTVETDDSGWYDTKNFTSSPVTDQHSVSSMREVARLRKSYELQSIEFQKLSEEKDAAKTVLGEVNSRLEVMTSKLKAKEAKEIELRARLASKKEEIKKFKDISNNFEDVKERLVGATNEILEHQLKEEALVKSLEEKENEVKSVEAEAESLKTEVANLKQESKLLKIELKNKEKFTSSIRLELNETKEDLQKSLGKAKDLDRTFQDLIEAKSTLELDLKISQDQNFVDRSRIEELENSRASTEFDKDRSKETLQSLETKFRKSEMDYQTANRSLTLVEGERDMLSSQNSALRIQVGEFTRKIAELDILVNKAKDSAIESKIWESKYLALQAEQSQASNDVELIPDFMEALEMLGEEKEKLEIELKLCRETLEALHKIPAQDTGLRDSVVENPASKIDVTPSIKESPAHFDESLSANLNLTSSNLVKVEVPAEVLSKVPESATPIQVDGEDLKSEVESEMAGNQEEVSREKVKEGEKEKEVVAVEKVIIQDKSSHDLVSAKDVPIPTSPRKSSIGESVPVEEEESLEELLRSAESAINESTLVEGVLAVPKRVTNSTPTPIFDFGALFKT